MANNSVIASPFSSDTSAAAPPAESVTPDKVQPADHTCSPSSWLQIHEREARPPLGFCHRVIAYSTGPQRPTTPTGVNDLQDDSTAQPEAHSNGPVSPGTSMFASTSSASIRSEARRSNYSRRILGTPYHAIHTAPSRNTWPLMVCMCSGSLAMQHATRPPGDP
jgi:hypothetical protein